MSWYEEALAIEPETEARRIQEFIAEQAGALGCSGGVLGLSGGIDSAVVTTLAARALGPENVLALIMPDRASDRQNERDAVALAKSLGITWEVRSITSILRRVGTYALYSPLVAITPRWVVERVVQNGERQFRKKTGQLPFLASLSRRTVPELAVGRAYCNSKHRVRAVLICFYAERLNALVLGCSNYTEHATGYYVQYGDDTGDIAPIQHLYKTQVFRLAEHLGVPRGILDKPPSPDLMPGVTDETALGLPYSRLDVVLAGLKAGRDEDQIASVTGVDAAAVVNVRLMCERSEPKRTGRVWLAVSCIEAQ